MGDFSAAKRALKKAYKLGSQKPEERETVIRTLKAGELSYSPSLFWVRAVLNCM